MSAAAQVAVPTARRLLRILGFAFGLAIGVGNTLGTGILRTPGEVAGYLGNAWMVFAVWIIGGLYALLCSSLVAELGAMLPYAGGWYVYSRRAFGERAGFVVGCLDWMAQCVTNGFLAAALGEFVVGLYPNLSSYVRWVGASGLAFLAILNWIGLRTGSHTQELTSLAKALGLVGLVVACFTLSAKSPSAPYLAAGLTQPKHSLLLGWVLALQGIVVTYDGWYAPIYLAEEDRDPARNLPRSMIGTALSCTGIFLLVNAAVFRVLGMDHLAGSQIPVADAAVLLFGDYGKQVILVLSVITVVSTINAGLLYQPRILYAMARDGMLPRRVTSVNQGGTPAIALFLCASASLALVLSGSFDTLIAIGSIVLVAVYLSGFISLLVLRRREPLLPRPYKAWLYPWSAFFVALASAAFLLGAIFTDLQHAAFTLILVFVSLVASLLAVPRPRENSQVGTQH